MTEPCGIIDTTVQCSENTFILLQQFSLAPSAEISRERCGNRPCISFKFSYFCEIGFIHSYREISRHINIDRR